MFMSVLLLGGCLQKPVQLSEPLIDVEPYRKTISWDEIEESAAQDMSGFLQVNTVNPPGNEKDGALWLAEQFEREGIPYEILEYGPNRANFVAKLEADPNLKSGEKPLCLLSHTDTVTFDESKWVEGIHPLSGHIDEEGYIWGRGALDMKSMTVMEMWSMFLLKRNNVPLHRDVYLLAVADEEVDGSGMQHLVNTYWNFLDCGQLVNEGGLGLKDMLFEGQDVYPISIGEKGNIWIKMWAYGDSGHGSTPRPNEAPKHLIEAINKLDARKIEPEIYEEMSLFFSAIGEGKGGATKIVMQNQVLANLLVKPKLMENPLTRAALINTVHLTGLEGSNAPNVVPAEVYAVLDCRILPGVDPDDFLEELQEIVGEDIKFEIIMSREGNKSPMDDSLYHALSRYSTAGNPNSVTGPVISVGFTDSVYARAKGVHAYGFQPITLSAEDMEGYHGKNERVSKEELAKGIFKLYSTVLEVSAVAKE